MIQTDITPDFITIDGAEGGTGAAPLEFADHMGMPLREALTYVHNMLIGLNLRDRIKLGPAARSPPVLIWREPLRLAQTGVIRPAASCSPLAAYSRSTATRTPAPLASPHRTKTASEPSSSTTKPNASPIFKEPPSRRCRTRCLGWSRLPGRTDTASFRRTNSRDEVESFADLFPPVAPGTILENEALPFYMNAFDRADARSFSPRTKIKAVA